MAKPTPLDQDHLTLVTGGASGGQVTLDGGEGDDTIIVSGISGSIIGGEGHDVLVGGELDDTFSGGEGHDAIFGGGGSDVMEGGEGHDWMDGGVDDGASDTARGGEGNDAFVWGPGDGNDSFDGGEGRDWLFLDGVTLDQVKELIRFDQDGVTLVERPDGSIAFTDADGNPMTVSGSLTVDGHTISFENIERIAFYVEEDEEEETEEGGATP